MGIRFGLKQLIKMYIQSVHLPAVYRRACRRTTVDSRRIIMADMHSDGLPFSMQAVYVELIRRGYRPLLMCKDTGKMSYRESLHFMEEFMKAYAGAGLVFISTYFLPVSSAKKRKETKVIQLWHSGGLLKKMGYDTTDDIPKIYKGNVTANYDLVTVSAPICEKVWEKALHLPAGTAKAVGLARTDNYFDKDWNDKSRNLFEEEYPEAKGKKIILYAPSFSGNAANPFCAGLELLAKKGGLRPDFFGEEYYLVVRPHPNLRKKYPQYFEKRERRVSSTYILSVTDYLITDYSSILFDYSIYKRPFVLFCPDIDRYEKNRGFYVDINKFPCPVTKTVGELKAVFDGTSELRGFGSKDELENFYQKYMGACDGRSLERIMDYVTNS